MVQDSARDCSWRKTRRGLLQPLERGRPAVAVAGDVLHVAGVGLDAPQPQAVARQNPLGQLHGLARGHPGATVADVQVHQHIQAQPGAGEQLLEQFDIFRVVDNGHQEGCGAQQRNQPRDLFRSRNRSGDQHIGDPGLHQGLGLRDLGRAYPDRAGGQLHLGQKRALVGLGVRPQRLAGGGDRGLHFLKVLVQQVQVQHQAGCVQLEFVSAYGFHFPISPHACPHRFKATVTAS